MSAVPARAPYWPTQLARAVPAVAVGLVITFSADHSALFGLITFGVFALATAIVIGWGSLRLEERSLRLVSMIQAIVAALCGIGALVFSGQGSGALFLALIIFAAATGFIELYLGLRGRERHPASRDWLTVGVLTAILAIAVLLVPADYALPWSVAEGESVVSGVLTSQIVLVGIFGAYAVLVGVYLVIGGLSARWTIRDENLKPQPVTGS